MPICICRFIHHAISGRETRQSRYKARVDLPEIGKRENQDCDLSCDGCFTYGIIHVLKDKQLLRGLISPLRALTGKPAPIAQTALTSEGLHLNLIEAAHSRSYAPLATAQMEVPLLWSGPGPSWQPLWHHTTWGGGAYGKGTVFKLDASAMKPSSTIFMERMEPIPLLV